MWVALAIVIVVVGFFLIALGSVGDGHQPDWDEEDDDDR
jgi:uncharacterized membrane protein